MFGNRFSLKISLSLFLSQKVPMNIRQKFDFQQAVSINWVGLKRKIRGSQGEKLAKRGNETTAVVQKSTTKYRDAACKAIFPFLFDTGF